MIICGAIDLGGTKIEARAFDGAMATVTTRRTATPVDTFDAFIAGLSAQIEWLCEQAGDPDLPIGIAVPGVIDPKTQLAFASNIPVTGHDIGATLKACFGRTFPLGNDCMALAFSEAHGGAGAGFDSVVGLIIGTGVGAGLCINGEIPPRSSGLAVEVGHLGMPAHALAAAGLPLWPCGCGKTGCMERYMAGSALGRLYEWKTGTHMDGPQIYAKAQTGDADASEVLTLWQGLVAECLLALQLLIDPACIVLGGGASMMPGLVKRLSEELRDRQLGQSGQPEILLAQHGDSSGARGMALLAMRDAK
ncbi:adenine methyltransferase [Loktanella sp. D2R18]|uniref:ROK family protein n=1 Tax=Rhodobacterales TaxID=204455 RepID=UPI000DEAB890|nr:MULTISPECIES: ROK family protein [Rhodobacterales]MDO6591902.1 ROK family protein [Yoonia sp. 1_MG-2023]RBW42667.1 adenine methyltransferase [Loktanella sp. D2R18]